MVAVMDLKSYFDEIKDQRSENPTSSFNGYLEDYLNIIGDDHALYETFKALSERDETLKIVVDLNFTVNKKNVANQIIRYKDAFKIPASLWTCPYILYGKPNDRNSYAIILAGESELDYLLSKGMYFTMTEIDAPLHPFRNKMLTTISDPAYFNLELFDKVLNHEVSIGRLQKSLDNQLFEDNQALLDQALVLSNEITEAIENDVDQEDYEERIYQTIIKWFLLKKTLYVQTMIDYDLRESFEGDLKAMRTLAKSHVDAIQFIPLAIMWRSKKRI